MKNSQKREQILNVFKKKDLLTANEVCDLLPEIDRATIYRNIKLFIGKGILREVNIKKGITSYELKIAGDIHQHFICGYCDKIVPVHIEPELIKTMIPENVTVEDFELNFKGKCQNCKLI